MNNIIKRVIKSYLDEKQHNNSKQSRKMSKSYCKKTPCKDMGFSQKASVNIRNILYVKFLSVYLFYEENHHNNPFTTHGHIFILSGGKN